ncbi:outer membrane beta-barrel protein [Polymorphobacter fuscus]|uniref:outer membrane beta-barrel protein n=1 Tax=Sandarakinorhabdus fusca TaxID=1439888 RepID=UPI00142FCB97|nr:outer membrane beta-barrel protein [Polymorphobacter fuscus]NJC09439.1 hypothetical protein [Polymorphobacter fuscus]
MRTGLLLAAALGVASAPAWAERPRDRFWAQGGGFFTTANSNMRLDNVLLGSSGTAIDFESDIGLPTHDSQPIGLVGVRLGRAVRIEGEYFRLKRIGNRSVAGSIAVGETVFNAQANVAGLLQSTTYRVALGYSPLLTDRAELGVALGGHITNFTVQLLGAGTVTTANGSISSALASEQRSQRAPLPTISGYGNYVLSPVFALNARADWLSLSVGDYSGSLVEAQAGVTARIIRNVGLGAGYRYTNYIFRARKRDFTGRLQYEFHGPIVSLEVAF